LRRAISNLIDNAVKYRASARSAAACSAQARELPLGVLPEGAAVRRLAR
jgi:K+-sensing histidine kinase KdpD